MLSPFYVTPRSSLVVKPGSQRAPDARPPATALFCLKNPVLGAGYASKSNEVYPAAHHEHNMAGGRGFEPQFTSPEPVVLPLDDPPNLCQAQVASGEWSINFRTNITTYTLNYQWCK
jgi:hypothetical protein